MIYTSYYGNLVTNPRGLTLVSVSNSIPKWFPWPCEKLRSVIPDWSLVNGYKSGEITEDEYRAEYLQMLNKRDRETVLQQLNDISLRSDGGDTVLLCWEGVNKFCHRHILAEWLDQSITELSII